jgi:hypothetical protein
MRRQKLKLGAAISEDRTFGHLLYRVAKPRVRTYDSA